MGSFLSLGFSHYKLIRNEKGMRIKINKSGKEYGEGGVCQCHGVSVLGIRVWVGLRAREKVGCTSSSPFFSFSQLSTTLVANPSHDHDDGCIIT